MALYTCAKCGKKVPMQYEVCPFCQTPRPVIKEPQEVPVKKKKKHSIRNTILVVLGVFIIAGAIGGRGKQEGDTSKEENNSSQSAMTQDVSSVPGESSSADISGAGSSADENKPGPCTLPSGFEIRLFYNTVRNDVTGRWRLSAGLSSIPISDCALEYYNTMFASDDEIHAVWNATLGTTTCIKVLSGLLFVDTYEYVDGEEHDAKLLFSGDLLTSEIIDLSSGEPWEG